MAKDSNYWKRRAIQKLIYTEKQEDKYIQRLKNIYKQARKNVERMIKNVYRNYSKETGLDVQTLKMLLSKSESKKEFAKLKRLGLGEYVKANYKSRITNLEKLQHEMYACIKRISPKEELLCTELYSSVYTNSYYREIFNVVENLGINISIPRVNDNMIKAVLQEPWSGKNFSKRIWKNTDTLGEELCEIVGGSLMSGQDINKTTLQVRDRFNVATRYAERLVRTESNHFHNEADIQAYNDMGVEKYVFIATLDNRTSVTCQKLDQKIFRVADKETGKNFPPMHPNCRSTTRAYIDAEVEKTILRRARDPITGKTSVIGNITYQEWYKKNVEKYGEEAINNSKRRRKNG